MKKILLLFISVILVITMMTSCFDFGNLGDNNQSQGGEQGGENNTPDEGNKPNDEGGQKPDDGNTENGDQKPDGGNTDEGKDEVTHLYNSFTLTEKKQFAERFGVTIPFIANDEYYIEEYTLEYEDCYEEGINFYTYGNTAEEFDYYREDGYSIYTFDGSQEDEYGDTWYYYSFLGFFVDMSYYADENGAYVVDVYVYVLREYDDSGDQGGAGNENQGGTGNENQGGTGNENQGGTTQYTYTDFTANEKQTIRNLLGVLIPFAPTNEYYVEEYYDETYGLNCICYYTFGNTEEDFTAFMLSFDGYELTDSFEDEDGDTWYCLEKGDVYIEMAYYTYEGDKVIDVYAYYVGEESGSGDSGNQGGSDNGGNNGNQGGSDYGDYDVITNEGAGLPTGTNGIYDLDFTKAENVKDVTDQGYYLDGCPTVGSPAVLVIPIEFSDAKASSKGCQISNIVTAFTGKNLDYYYSVEEYYYISSYGKLDLDITVVDSWFCPEYSSNYYANLTDSDGYFNGDQVILDEALAYLSGIMDLSDFDSDGNGIIDAVVMINTLEIGDDDFHWAYRYWNYYVDDNNYYYEYDGVSANDYLWASYFFMQESYDENGDAYYDDSSVMNTYTYIHEFGHILGADDYYDTSNAGNHPLDGCDVMDGMTGDHNPYTKFNLGWITTSKLVTTNTSLTLTLNSFTETGDSIIIANNWNDSLGAYQEYYVIVYYTMTGLNGGDAGYFSRDGIIVYHVNSSLYREEYEGEIYYDVFNTNTDPSDQYGTEDNLIEFVKSAEGNFTFAEGESLPSVTDDQGNKLGYTFTVDSIDGDGATITITKR